jgi:hypothetical protein
MRSKKWWQKVMVFTFDQGLVNQYIMYLERCVELDHKPLTHMQFHMGIVDYLVAPAILVRESKRFKPSRENKEKESAAWASKVIANLKVCGLL